MSDGRDGARRPQRPGGARKRPAGTGRDDRAPRAGGDRKPGNDRTPSSERRPGTDRKPGADRAGGDRRSNTERAPFADRKAGGDRKPFTDRKAGSDRRPGAERVAGKDRPRREAGRPGADEKRLWTRGGKPARGDRDAREREPREDRDPFGTKSVRPRHDDPDIPDSITPNDLDRLARNELKTLSAENAEWVARHLAMAARLIDEDPELAHRHAISAARRAGRIGIARETLAITAYATGDYALALRELRTYRRITGRDDQLPMMVDSERGLDRPERALELGRSVARASLPVPVQVELAIAMSGARLDLGDAEAALRELEIPQLDPSTAYSYSPGLFDAYATVLEDLGRDDEAAEWFRRAEVAAAALGGTDADDDVIEVIEEELPEA